MIRVCSQCHDPELAADQQFDKAGWKGPRGQDGVEGRQRHGSGIRSDRHVSVDRIPGEVVRHGWTHEAQVVDACFVSAESSAPSLSVPC